MIRITSLKNETIKDLVKLKQKKYRDTAGQVLLEGEHLRQEVKLANLKHTSIGLEDGNDIQITPEIAQKLSQTVSGSTEFTLIDKPEYLLDLQGSRYLLCDGIQDPGNLGTMIRTAHSFGFDAVLVSEDSVDIFNEKCLRATQGSFLHIPCIRTNLLESINQLKKAGVQTYATNLSDETIPLSKVSEEKVAFVLGSEGQGVSQSVLDSVSSHVKIETSHFESLNVAIATGIICYQFRK